MLSIDDDRALSRMEDWWLDPDCDTTSDREEYEYERSDDEWKERVYLT